MNEISYCEIENKKLKNYSNLDQLIKFEPLSLICANIFHACIFKVFALNNNQ